MGTPLPRSSPSEQDVDPAAVMALLDELERRPGIEMHSLMVVRHGHVVAEGWWAPYSPDRKHLLYSLSKSFTSAAAGLAVSEGLIDLDDPVVAHFPEIDAAELDPRSRAMTLRHVASMASGHTRDTMTEAWARDPHEPVRGFLLVPPDHDPGTVFAYNQPCTYTLAAVVQRRAGMSLSEYLRPRLLDPLGVDDVGWHAWPEGRELGFTGLHARTEDVAKLGLLHLRGGRWGDRQLLPEAWVRQATSKQVANDGQPSIDWRQGYGFQFWMARHGYRGDGAFGQFCVVLPEHDTVVATTACTEEMQQVLDALWTHLLPGLGRSDAVADPTLEDSLRDRLRRLELSTPAGEDAPADWVPWSSARFPVAREVAVARTPSMLGAVAVDRDADGLVLTLHEPDGALAVPVGTDSWRVSEPADRRGDPVPVAAAGGWVDLHTLRVEVRFLETPHRLDLTLALPDRTAVVLWSHPPLGSDRFEAMHSPGS